MIDRNRNRSGRTFDRQTTAGARPCLVSTVHVDCENRDKHLEDPVFKVSFRLEISSTGCVEGQKKRSLSHVSQNVTR